MRFDSDKSAGLPVKESRRENPRYNEKSGRCVIFLSSPTKDFTISDPRSDIYSFKLCTV